MGELAMLVGAALLVAIVAWTLRHEHHPLTRDHQPTMDVQNHEGDE